MDFKCEKYVLPFMEKGRLKTYKDCMKQFSIIILFQHRIIQYSFPSLYILEIKEDYANNR